MKILFISRATLFSTRGGDTIQMEKTAAHLIQLGVQVVIKLCNEKNINYSQFQLIHFFNITRPADIIFHIDRSNLPFVLSPVYLEFGEEVKYDHKGIRNWFLAHCNNNTSAFLKCIARWVRNGEEIISFKYILFGHRRSIKYILRRCSHLLPNSQSEYLRLKAAFPMAGAYSIIPNSIDHSIFHISQDQWPEKQTAVLCVARIEQRKNQLNIIKAMAQTAYPLTLVTGTNAPNQKAYYKACKKAAGDRVHFVDFLEQDKIAELYRTHKVHILASYFETTGLSSLEAAACGCNLVISDKGDTREYFSDNAQYCQPQDLLSIRQAIDRAMNGPVREKFMENIKKDNNWDLTATKTFNVYKKVLKL